MNNTSSMKPGGLDRSAAALAPAPAPLGAYRRVIAHDGLVWLSGMLPLRDGRPAWTGTLGDDCSVEDGIAAARLAAENAVAALYADLGSLAHLRVVRLGVYLRTTPTFTDHPRVADAASLRVRELLGARAEHTRLVFGVASLPGGMPVELEVVCMVSVQRTAS